MKKLITLVLALVMCLSLVACGGGPDKQPAIDAFNAANTAFAEVANQMNENPEAFPEDTVESMIELGEVLAEHKAMLEGDEELSEEKLEEMIAWYASVEEMIAEIKVDLGIE